jgi:hypothetical protein
MIDWVYVTLEAEDIPEFIREQRRVRKEQRRLRKEMGELRRLERELDHMEAFCVDCGVVGQ